MAAQMPYWERCVSRTSGSSSLTTIQSGRGRHLMSLSGKRYAGIQLLLCHLQGAKGLQAIVKHGCFVSRSG